MSFPWRAFLDASLFSALFTLVLFLGVRLVGKLTREKPLSPYNWDKPRLPRVQKRPRSETPRPSIPLPRDRSPGAEL